VQKVEGCTVAHSIQTLSKLLHVPPKVFNMPLILSLQEIISLLKETNRKIN
jgi:hypothetical protein